MTGRTVRIRGTGQVSVAAYGMADAEHLVEKELSKAAPGAAVSVLHVRRGGERRIVEEFEVEYRIEMDVDVDEDDAEKAAGAAFRHARLLLSGTRYRLARWESVSPLGS